MSIRVHKHTEGDSRVATELPTYAKFQEANLSHIQDVKELGKFFSNYLNHQLVEHDWTKTTEPYASMFYRALCDTIQGRVEFTSSKWCKLHYEELERHHLARYSPEDVNLIDVVEMVCDCVAAGMARSGYVSEITIPAEVLMQAVDNTVKLLKEEIEVVE